MNLRVLVFLFLMTAIGCEKSNEPSLEIAGLNYFPLNNGSYIIYDVDSVIITQNVETAYNFQVRVSIEEHFVNGEGNTSYVLQREKRADEAGSWKPAGTWTAYATSRQAVVTEGNISYIKLQFPVSVGLGWNGNALNDRGGPDRCNGIDCDRYEITEEDDTMIVVTQENSEDVLSKDVRIEKYEKDIGLVYKESTVYKYCESGDCFGTDFVVEGSRYKMEKIAGGKF